LAKRQSYSLAVLFLDLDGFKAVNDSFGHKQGDWVLTRIGQRLVACVRESDTVARLGGDEFAILLENVSHTKDILPVISKILKAVAEPFLVQNTEACVTSSIGVSVYPMDGTTPDDLIENADKAMYQAKNSGKNAYEFFTSPQRKQPHSRA
jgi:diguanylate cyclase (GGDEF)-like protein